MTDIKKQNEIKIQIFHKDFEKFWDESCKVSDADEIVKVLLIWQWR